MDVTGFLKANWKNFAALLLIVIVSVGGYLFYKRRKANKEEQEESDKNAEVFFFFTAWCPHCKKARPEWDAFAAKFEKKSVNGYIVTTTAVDCDQNEALADKYGVKGYPTIKCVVNGKVAELDGPVTAANLSDFVTQCLN